jgi:hypothetical protein
MLGYGKEEEGSWLRLESRQVEIEDVTCSRSEKRIPPPSQIRLNINIYELMYAPSSTQ